jgi:hypothetical protein
MLTFELIALGGGLRVVALMFCNSAKMLAQAR